jgi:adenine phosphoribosyltransferase
VSNFDYESLIVDIPDYPEPGVIFKDITPLIGDPQGFAAAIDEISEHFMGKGITKVVGAEARGFLVGAPVAYRLGCGFVPARKPGKLPREVYSESYALEYATDELEIHKDALSADDRVLVVDDLVATGGTAVACAKIIEKAGAEFYGFAFLMELAFLNPRDIIGKDFDQEIFTLFKVE